MHSALSLSVTIWLDSNSPPSDCVARILPLLHCTPLLHIWSQISTNTQQIYRFKWPSISLHKLCLKYPKCRTQNFTETSGNGRRLSERFGTSYQMLQKSRKVLRNDGKLAECTVQFRLRLLWRVSAHLF